MNKRTLPKLVAASFLLTPIAASLAQAAPAGRVLMVIGDANAERAGQKIALKRGTLVEEGDRLTTAAGASVQVMFTDQGLIALRENTSFKIEKFSFQQGKDAANFKLEKGGVRTVTGAVGKANNRDYSLDAVVATIGIRGTNFELVLCESQCGDSGNTAKNGLYGVVRGASGGTSRIVIGNDSGEKLLGKNDAFFVADKSSPPQQLVAPPSFVTQRTESAKKSADKPKDAEKTDSSSQSKSDSQETDKPKEAAKEAEKSDNASQSQATTEQAKSDSQSQSQSQSQTQAQASTPAPAPAPSPATNTPATTTTTTPTATTSTLVSAFVPPPTNQSTLFTSTTFEVAPTPPPLVGGSQTTAPGGTTLVEAAAITPTPSPTPSPTPAPTPAPTPSPAPAPAPSRAHALSLIYPGFSVETASKHQSDVTYAAGTDKPISFSYAYSSGESTYNQKYSVSDPNAVTGLQTILDANGGVKYVWGRWGGPTAAISSFVDDSPTSTFPLADLPTSLHFVAGPPPSSLPTEGVASYNLVGYTTPTYTNYGTGTQADAQLATITGSTDVTGANTGTPIIAKVGYTFAPAGATLATPPFVALQPFRINVPAVDDQSAFTVFAGDAGSLPNAFKPIVMKAQFAGPGYSGPFSASVSSIYATPSSGEGVLQSGIFGDFTAQLMGNTGHGLGIGYALTNFGDWAVSGAMLLTRDQSNLTTPIFTSTTGSLSVAAFTGVGGQIGSATASAGNITIQSINNAANTSTLPQAFLSSTSAIASEGSPNISYLANLGKGFTAQTPIVRDDAGVLPGYTWGRWITPLVTSYNNALISNVAAIKNGDDAATNLHFVTGPTLSALPASGVSTYTLFGATPPTSASGETGTVLGVNDPITLGTAPANTVFGSLKAEVGHKFSVLATAENPITDGAIAPYLRLDAFKIAPLVGGQLQGSSLTLAGMDSVLGHYTPIQINASVGDASRFTGSTFNLYDVHPQRSGGDTVLLSNGSFAEFNGQLMGNGASGLAISYRVEKYEDNIPGEYFLGSLVFTRTPNTVVPRAVTTEQGALIGHSLSFQSFNGTTLEDVIVDRRASANAAITFHDGKPVGVNFGGFADFNNPESGGSGNFTIANYSGPNSVIVEGIHTDGTSGETFSWGRWNGGGIVSAQGGSPYVQNPIGKVQFVAGPPLTNLPASGSATYNVTLVGANPSITSTISTDGVARTLSSLTLDGSPTSIAATVNFGSAASNALTLDGFKLGTAPTALTHVVAGAGTVSSSIISPSSVSTAVPITFNPVNNDPTLGRYTANNAAVFDGTGTGRSASATLGAQLMGNGASGLGVIYTVNENNGTINHATTGAMFLKRNLVITAPQ